MSLAYDYLKSVFLNAYGNGKPLKNNEEYQRYFLHEFNLTNPRKFHEQMISEGYLQPTSDKDFFSSLKVSELKEICESIGLSKTGNKNELIERIMYNANESQLKSFQKKDTFYSLSERGKEFIDNHQDYIELHRHTNWDISISKYCMFKNKLKSDSTFYDVVFEILNERIKENQSQYSILRNTYYNLSELMDSKNNFNDSLKYLLYVLFFDVSGIDNLELFKYCTSKEELLNRYHFFGFAPGAINKIAKLEQYYSEDYILTIYSQYSCLPLNLCSIENFKNIVNDIFLQPSLDEMKYKNIFYENFKTYVNKNKSYLINSTQKPQKSSGCLTSILICLLAIVTPIFLLIK